MITKVYTLFDSKAAVFGTPFFMPNSSMALRAFSDLVGDRMTMVSRHPVDFTLFEIGKYDDSVGVLESCDHVNLGNAAQFVVADNFLPFTNGRDVKKEVAS